MKRPSIFIFLLVVYQTFLLADVSSSTGTVGFDVQENGNREMVLNTTGLGIGVVPSTNLHVQGNTIFSEELTVGSTSVSSNLHISGSMALSVQTLSTNATLSDHSLVLANTSSGNITLTLPSASTMAGRHYIIKKTSADHTLTLSGLLDEFVMGELTNASQGFSSCEVFSNGVQWYLLSASDDFVGIGYTVEFSTKGLEELATVMATPSSDSRAQPPASRAAGQRAAPPSPIKRIF